MEGTPVGGQSSAFGNVDPATRKAMQANRRRDTGPELVVRRMLRELGYPGYRIDWAKAPGRPDIAYPGRKVAIFVNGCFWHHCPVCDRPYPMKNREFWTIKIERTIERDRRAREALERDGWTVIVIWEHELTRKEMDATRERLSEKLESLFRREGSSEVDADKR